MATEKLSTTKDNKEKDLIKDEVTGLWTRKEFLDQCVIEYLDVKKHHKSCEDLKQNGMENNKLKGITTLEEKANVGSYAEIIMLAGVAKKNSESAFSKIEEEISVIKTTFEELIFRLEKINLRIENLKEMAVIN